MDEQPIYVPPEGGILLARLEGELDLQGVRAGAVAALRAAGSRGCFRVLVDATGAKQLTAPTFVARIEIAHELAAAAFVGTALAVVAPAAVIDDERIGAVLATRLGLRAHICDSVDEALDWLRAQEPLASA